MTHAYLDPLATADAIERDYRSYLQTTFNPADEGLRSELAVALADGTRIRRGPILQASPPYTPGASLADLMEAGVLTPGLAALPSSVLPIDRPLFRHQEDAIRAARQGRNLIVATGTGSGKTECYLLPIVDSLLREREAGTLARPGVRALLLYPMNALANDQMKRIRELLAAFPDITFGRYIGDTKRDPRQALAEYRQRLQADPLPNELIDRPAMQAAPPHVLLTNYAMLEYLLLRPDDSPFFDGPTGEHWSHIVLDEVHVYDGARGAELGMLLRRVRDRVLSSERGRLQCIGTSATLGRGAADVEEVSQFAQALFNERVEPGDVVLPDRLPLKQGDGSWTLSPQDLDELHALVRHETPPDSRDLLRWLQRAGAPEVSSDLSLSATLWAVLKDETNVLALQEQLESRSSDLLEISAVFSEAADQPASLVKLVDLCVFARRDERSAPLLPARYHLFLRASEGAYVCWASDHPGDQPRLLLDRHEVCPACEALGRSRQVFELAVCRHCGADYAVGRLQDGRLQQAPAFERKLIHLFREEAGALETALDEDEVASNGEVEGTDARTRLCTTCGETGPGELVCQAEGHESIPVTQVGSADAELRRCASCGRHSTVGISLRFLSGSEAPVSVVATSLYQSLPPLPDPPRRASAAGRKLLMFSDSRQDAAFFAPYLSRTYSRALERRLIWEALAKDPDVFRVEELIQPVRREAERLGVLSEDGGRANASLVRTWLMAELLATDRRQSLDGVGLAEIAARIPSRMDPPPALMCLGLSEDEAFDTLRVLMESVRQSASVSVPDDVNVKEDLRFAPRNTTTHLRGEGSERGVLAWMPGRGLNRRLDFITKVMAARQLSGDPLRVLNDLWQDITRSGEPFASVLTPVNLPRIGTVFSLAYDQIEFRPAGPNHQPKRCERCRQVWWRDVAGVCPSFRCPGTLVPVGDGASNHYRKLYEQLQPMPLVVEEHTGQLRSEHAAELQEKFVRGEINSLSCSTTFELGVDVGEVQAVLMRNVPPSAANYVQRAGRAGRRLGSAALVTTFAQRRSHDLHFFDNPAALVDGHVAPPVVVMDNDAIVRRHVHAVAWAEFERLRADRGEPQTKRTVDLVRDESGTSVAARFLAWLRSRPSDLGEALARLVPADVADTLGLASWEWVARLHERDEQGVGGWLSETVDDIRCDLNELRGLEEEAAAQKKYPRAGAIKRIRETIETRPVIDLLAQRGVLPKYGFPVDVVELDLSRSEEARSKIDLSRDLRLAILEFAPGAKVVAANHLWRSRGVRRPPGRGLPVWAWGICEGCGVLRTQIRPPDADLAEELTAPCAHCGSVAFESGRRGRFVIPLFGFVGDKDPQEPGDARPPREGYLETYFAEFDGAPPPVETVTLGAAPIGIRTSKRGWITVFNRGRSRRGFTFCFSCGHASDEPPARRRKGAEGPPAHKVPYAAERECSGRLTAVDLGHRFLTNVMELELPWSSERDVRDREALSTVNALLAGLPAIGISQQDVGGSLSVGSGGERRIVLFDEVPGGAGHTRLIREHLGELIEQAMVRVSSCACGEETSCYGCLRSYRNQSDHDQLTRGDARNVLARVMG